MKLLFLLLAFTLASPQKSARIVIDKSEPQSVVLAAQDLAGDVRKITGIELKTVRSSQPRKGDVFISTKEDGRWEAYSVGTDSKGVLRFTGSDVRGTMFAIYDFCENYLGIDPMWYWDQAIIPTRKSLEWDSVSIEQDSPTVKFRGWFINDEDFLTGWNNSGKVRHINYNHYNTVVNRKNMERVVEALVRGRYNMIIPGTLMWILSPDEKEILDLCAERGVFISMHHVEPMGVSAYSYEYYWGLQGKKYNFSYWSQPKEMEHLWKLSAEQWAKYPNVIWQIGLRGIGDRPMWYTDKNTPTSEQERAALISKAMQRQIEILDEVGVPRTNRYVTTTLWAEGSIFHNKGYLKIPEGTHIIFADNSPGWAWQEDFRSTPRRPEYGYGVYYHFQLIGMGPHLVSLVPAEKTYSMLKEAVDKGAGEYVMINVGNVREFSYNIDAGSKMLWNMSSFSAEKWQKEWISKHFSKDADKWMSCINAYHHALQIHPSNKIPAFLDGMLFHRSRYLIKDLTKELKEKKATDMVLEPYYNEYAPGKGWEKEGDAFWKSMSMNQLCPFKSRLTEYASVSAQTAAFKMVKERMELLYSGLDEAKKPFAYSVALYPATMMYCLSGWYTELLAMRECYDNGELKKALSHKAEAQKFIDDATSLENTYCTGKFEGWWSNCKKVNIKLWKQKLEELLLFSE